jgi:hypothetical protein
LSIGRVYIFIQSGFPLQAVCHSKALPPPFAQTLFIFITWNELLSNKCTNKKNLSV